MGLGLLVPGALALSALAALPVLAHLSRQVPRDRRAFGAMLLLERVVKRLRRRRRLKDVPLMLLRVLALLAVVAAAAGARFTFAGGAATFGGSGKVVVIVDRSMSMSLSDGGSTLLQRARGQAVDLVSQLPDGTLVAAVAYDDRADRLVPALTVDHERVLGRLRDVQPTSGGSDLRGALLEARRLLGGEKGEVVVFTDEAGGHMVLDASEEIAALVAAGDAVIPRPVHAEPPRDVTVSAAQYGEGVEGGQVIVRVRNYGPSPMTVTCDITLPDGAAIPVFADLPAAAADNGPPAEVEEHVTVPTEAKGGVGRAHCDDPDLPLDDTRYFHLPQVGAARVLVVDGDPGDTPTRSEVYFLERALSPWGGTGNGVKPDVTTPLGLAELDPEQHRVVFLANVADPRPWGPRLIDFVRRGGNLVIAAGDNITADRYNSALGPILPSGFRKPDDVAGPGEPGVALALPDVSLPLFEPFARAGRGGFGRVHTRRMLTLDPYTDSEDVHTWLRWETGQPALVERKLGSGRVLVWTSTVDTSWGNLPLESVFMPHVQRLVGYLGGQASGGEARFDATVDEPVTIPLPDVAMDPEVTGPDGQPVKSHVEASQLVFTPETPGGYEIRVETAPPLAWVAANTPPDESDVRRYEGLAMAESKIDPDLFQRHIDLGPGLLGAALAMLLLQAVLSLRGQA